jgi:hypothetical protein
MQRKHLDDMLVHMADTVTLRTPLAAEPLVGKPAIRPVVATLLQVIDTIVFREVLEGPAHVAAFFEIKAAGTELQGVDYWRLGENGLIQEMNVFWRPLPAILAVNSALAAQ